MAAFIEADTAGAHVAEQSDSQQTGLGYAGLAAPEDAERDMLHLDDELAGLIEAADTPAGQAGPQSTKPEIVSLMAGEAAFAHSLSARLAKSSGVLCMWVCIAFL